jgi:hypothetical protein
MYCLWSWSPDFSADVIRSHKYGISLIYFYFSRTQDFPEYGHKRSMDHKAHLNTVLIQLTRAYLSYNHINTLVIQSSKYCYVSHLNTPMTESPGHTCDTAHSSTLQWSHLRYSHLITPVKKLTWAHLWYSHLDTLTIQSPDHTCDTAHLRTPMIKLITGLICFDKGEHQSDLLPSIK